MLHRFIGRTRELQLLNELKMKKSASLVIIRGRRRVGKSRLIQEFSKDWTHYAFSGLPPEKGISDQDQREEFARQLQRELKIPLPRADDWGDLFWHLSQSVQKGPFVVVLDEISWMGSKDPTFLGKLKTAWDLYFKNNPQLILIICGSISTWIEKNILSSTGFLGRVSLDLTLEELLLYECAQFWEHDHVSAYEKFKILSVTGGIPKYLEEVLPQKSAEANILRLCFQKEGLLFNEFERVFSDLFLKRSPTYKKIVQGLADGPSELKDIYRKLGVKKGGVINEYMDDLVTSGFVSHDHTWHLKEGIESKLSRFRLKDNYLRFYLKYIDKNKRKIESGWKPQWDPIFGLQFENLVLKNRKAIYQQLEIDPSDLVYDNPFFQKKTKIMPGCQVDYLIQTRHGSCYLCEIKFNKSEIAPSIINEMKLKMKNLKRPKYMSLRPVLIHVNGVHQDVQSSGFFASIIPFEELLHKL